MILIVEDLADREMVFHPAALTVGKAISAIKYTHMHRTTSKSRFSNSKICFPFCERDYIAKLGYISRFEVATHPNRNATTTSVSILEHGLDLSPRIGT